MIGVPPPQGFTTREWGWLRRQPADVLLRILERAAIIFYGCGDVSWEHANRRAMREECPQRAMFGGG